MKIHIHTLGCKVNQYESQAMEVILRSRGHEICGEGGGCDAVIINTCAVTGESGRKSRQAIRRLKAENPDAVCAVCGCYSQISPDDITALGADIVFGSGDRLEFLDALERAFNDRRPLKNIDNPMKRRTFEVLPSGNIGTRTRAALKIEDGCSNFCSYCVIPYARGPVRSLLIADIEEQAQKLQNDGYGEIIITGIEIASYGKDFGIGIGLADAVEAVHRAAPDARLRLGSLEARVITENFVSRLKNLGCVCPHFHLSLQSGCDKTLKAMNRKYDTAQFYEAVTLLRRYFPDCALTADLIAGFPGETREDFDDTLLFIRKCGFSAMHIFPYSVRPGTPAEKMPMQLSRREKEERAALAARTAAEMQREYLNRQVGRTLSVLFETEHDGQWQGHSENYLEVRSNGENLRGAVRNVKIKSVFGTSLYGVIEE